MALTREQSSEIAQAIESRRRALLDEVREDLARARSDSADEIAGPSGDAGDDSVAELIGDLDRHDLRRDATELRAIEAARGRLREGSFDECMECGGEIGFARLRANPAAVRCIDCQRRYEKTYGGEPAPTL